MNRDVGPPVVMLDGKIYTGKPDQFDGKFTMVSGSDFPQQTNPVIHNKMV